jgi:hypothetical protein
MRKFILYLIFLVVFIPGASYANTSVHNLMHAVKASEILKTLDSEDTEESGDSLQTIRVKPDFQDTVQSGRRKRIKEVAKARSQPKPERVPNRPPPDPSVTGNEGRRPAERPPAEKPAVGRQPGIQPGDGINRGGGMNRGGAAGGQGGMNGGGQGAGRQQPPPQRGR